MQTQLPKLIETYIRASNEADLETFISCFSDTATVLDEGEVLTGHEALKKWFIKTRKNYQFKSEPLDLKTEGEAMLMKAKVSGNFPGSPVTLEYQFRIQSGLIQDLKIH